MPGTIPNCLMVVRRLRPPACGQRSKFSAIRREAVSYGLGVLQCSSPNSRAGVVDEFLRRRLAPLRHQGFLYRPQVRAVGEIETVAVGPMLVDAAPGIGPVVVDLTAQDVPADPPHVLVTAELLEIVVSHAD